ncbi:MAG: hypothetical protein AAFQ43_01690 [Bacteroidota bacterium]
MRYKPASGPLGSDLSSTSRVGGPLADPAERWAVSDREKALQTHATPAGEPIVVTSGEGDGAPEAPVVG